MRARLVLPLVAIALAACGGDSTTGPKPPAHFSDISVTDAGFSPETLNVQTNTQVTWTVTSGSQSHVLKFTGEDLPNGNPNSNVITNGQTATTTFIQTGTYHYDDTLHVEHTGVIIVQ
jgi:plastocyanin